MKKILAVALLSLPLLSSAACQIGIKGEATKIVGEKYFSKSIKKNTKAEVLKIIIEEANLQNIEVVEAKTGYLNLFVSEKDKWVFAVIGGNGQMMEKSFTDKVDYREAVRKSAHDLLKYCN